MRNEKMLRQFCIDYRREDFIAHTTEYIQYIEVQEKQGECNYTPSWSLHHNFVCHGRYTERERGPSPGWADFTIMMECTPESGHCHSVYPVAQTAEILVIYKDTEHGCHMYYGHSKRCSCQGMMYLKTTLFSAFQHQVDNNIKYLRLCS